LLPVKLAKELDNGLGRDAPNQYPVLPEPQGRFSFDLFSPISMLNQILGPVIMRKLCCIITIVVLLYFTFTWGIYFVGNIIATLIGNAVAKK
jgi:hypothetical protein